jgi:hypothetical protein
LEAVEIEEDEEKEEDIVSPSVLDFKKQTQRMK